MKRCVILALNGCPLTSVTGPMEILLLARRLAEDSQWQVEVVAENGRQVQSSGGLQIVAHRDIQDVDSADLLIVGAIDGPYLHQTRVAAPTLAWVRQLHQQGCRMVSVCTGAYVLAAAGVLDGRQATSHWSVIDWLAQQFPDCLWQKDAMITEDGQVACSGGASAYQDMSLLLVRQLFGDAIGRQVAKSVLIDPGRHSQQQYSGFVPQRQHQDDVIQQVQNWLDQHVCDHFALADLARLANLSERQFKRRFKQATQQTPLAYIQLLRVEKAKQALESSRQQIDVISRNCGYEDVRFFRQLFKRHTGLAPSEYRSKFGS